MRKLFMLSVLALFCCAEFADAGCRGRGGRLRGFVARLLGR